MATLFIKSANHSGKPKLVDATTLPIGQMFVNQAGFYCIKTEVSGPDDAIQLANDNSTWTGYNIGTAELVVPCDGELTIIRNTP